jgi:hypothetical protein
MDYLRWIASSRRHPSAVLLYVQLAGMLLYPFVEATEAGRIAFGVFGVAVLIVTTRMVRSTPGLAWISAGIALPAVVLQILQAVYHRPDLLVLSSALEAAFYFYAAGSLIAYMTADLHATTDELFAAGATFTLFARTAGALASGRRVVGPGGGRVSGYLASDCSSSRTISA